MSRFTVGACGAVLVFAVAGCGAASATRGHPTPASTPAATSAAATASAVVSATRSATPSVAVSAADVDEAVARVDALGTGRFVAQYTGLEVVADGMVVYRKPSVAFDAAIAALGLQARVHLRDAPYAAGELRVLTERIAADFGYWQQRGVLIVGVGPRTDGTGVQVGLPEPGDAARLLTAHYGATPPITVVQQDMGVPAAAAAPKH